MKPGGILQIDLHGCSVEETKRLVTTLFLQARERNIKNLYFITGKGNHVLPDGSRGVLKKVMPKILDSYKNEIERVEEEVAAFKVSLKSKFPDPYAIMQRMLANFSDSPLDEQLIQYLLSVQAKAKNKNVAAMLELACVYLSGIHEKFNDKEKAIDLLEQARQLGSIEATTLLGVLYLEGQLVKTDYKKAKKYLNHSANQGEVKAQFYLASFWLMGQAGYKNDAEGRKWMEKAAEQGDVTAQHTLAVSYKTEDFTELNYTLAVGYLKKAVLKNYAPAQTELARCYATGQGVERNLTMAFLLYKKAAAQNEIFALFQLGEYYLDGRGGEKNDKLSFENFLQAARLGDADAQGRVSEAYFKGTGVEKDIPEGILWLQKAVDQKSPGAFYAMAKIYQRGLAGEKKKTEALNLLLLSAKSGFARAKKELGIILEEASADSNELSLIFNYFLKAAQTKKDNSDAQASVAYAYLYGIGIKQDSNKGITWLEKALEQNNPYAMYIMAHLCREGFLGEDQKQNALLFLYKAAELGFMTAQFELGSILLKTNPSKGEELLQKAFAQGCFNEKETDENLTHDIPPSFTHPVLNESVNITNQAAQSVPAKEEENSSTEDDANNRPIDSTLIVEKPTSSPPRNPLFSWYLRIVNYIPTPVITVATTTVQQLAKIPKNLRDQGCNIS